MSNKMIFHFLDISRLLLGIFWIKKNSNFVRSRQQQTFSKNKAERIFNEISSIDFLFFMKLSNFPFFLIALSEVTQFLKFFHLYLREYLQRIIWQPCEKPGQPCETLKLQKKKIKICQFFIFLEIFQFLVVFLRHQFFTKVRIAKN